MLQLGERTYEIKDLKTKSDGSLRVPSNSTDIAYWVDETSINYVFALNPTEENLAFLNSLKQGDQATLTWDNCNTVNFNLSTPELTDPDNATLLSQETSGITVFIPNSSDKNGFMVKGELAGESINVFNTPDASEIQAEISLLKTSSSNDKKTVEIEISILNSGPSSFTLTSNDVSLTPEGDNTVAPTDTHPSLPYEIEPGETVTMQLTFPRPSTTTATLKILSTEYDLEGY